MWHVSVAPMQFLNALRVVVSPRGFPRALALFANSSATFPRRWVETGPFQRVRFWCLKTDHPAMQKVRMRTVATCAVMTGCVPGPCELMKRVGPKTRPSYGPPGAYNSADAHSCHLRGHDWRCAWTLRVAQTCGPENEAELRTTRRLQLSGCAQMPLVRS